MNWPPIFTTALGLGLVVLLMLGLAFVIRRLNLAPALAGIAAGRFAAPSLSSCRVGRGCTLSVVTLDGVRFAVLNGPKSDQLRILPDPSREIRT